jgi:hypothetical protein
MRLPAVGEIPGILTASTAALLCVSAVNYTVYFWVLGGGFQGFMSASDYLVDSIYWLPYYAFGILGFVFGTSYNATVPALLNKLENRKDIQPPSFAASQIILVVIVNIVLILL